MPSRLPYQIPGTPRVISPSPTPSDVSVKEDYFAPVTRSKGAVFSVRQSTVEPIDEAGDDEEANHGEDPALRRARPRRRSSQLERRPARLAIIDGTGSMKTSSTTTAATVPTRRKKLDEHNIPNGQVNGFLSPDSSYPKGFGAAYWRSLSRSPSPFGLIPIHREWRAFVHKYEVPRKALHVSIGALTLWLYHGGAQTSDVHPVLLAMLVPIFAVDLIRFRWPAFNQVYIKIMGALMRESEAHDQYNGVISYLAGLWATARFCHKDVFVMSVLLLSWCDTAASTFGRLWGKYTPRIRRGKSLAGSLAAFLVGAASAVLFWAVVAPRAKQYDVGANSFAFDGTLTLPPAARQWLGLGLAQATISGPLALAVVSIFSGIIVSLSEAVDLWGLDDNLTIPLLCGMGLEGLLWLFGS